MMQHTFARLPGDHASYVLGDPAGAIKLASSVPSLAVDIETRGLDVDAWTITAVALGTTNHVHVLDPVAHAGAIRMALGAAPELVLHNSPFDVPILYVAGLLRLADVDRVYDTLVTARLAYPSERVSKSLGKACERHLGPDYGTLKKALEDGFRGTGGRSKRQMFLELGLRSAAFVNYAAFDVVMTARLRSALPDQVVHALGDHPYSEQGDAPRLVDREQTVNRTLLRRSCLGLQLDLDVVDELKAEMLGEMHRQDMVLEAAGIDVDGVSPTQLKEAVVNYFEHAGLLPAGHRRLKNGRPSAAAPALERVHHPVTAALKARSEAERFSRDYADKLVLLSGAADGRVHPRVGVLAARTGRMTYTDPPVQQLPARVRRMLRFDAPATSMDWAGIEPVFFANVVGEERLVTTFEAGGDVYLPVAEVAGVSRPVAKTIVLAQLYGQGVTALAGQLDINPEEASELIGRVRAAMPEMQHAIGKIRGVANVVGKVLTLSGRVIPLDPDPTTGYRRYYGYKGVNAFVQGSCYDLLAEAIYEIHQQGLDDAVFVAIHDELVVATEAAVDVERIMRTPPPEFIRQAGRVPVLRVSQQELGDYWQAKE